MPQSTITGDAEEFSDFWLALKTTGYTGDVSTDTATRVVYSTDNSVYELMPEAVLFPKEPDDLNRIMRAAQLTAVPIVARGGGTGTNGQSLTDKIIVDCSRYLTSIEHIDPETRTAVVQPGVILNQLNREIEKHGLIFGPTVSTAAQATLGGMAATDASGKGSRVFGRTSDHIESMDIVLSDGTDWTATDLQADALETVCARGDLAGHVHRTVRTIHTREREEIDRVFPIMNRGLTGYNLKDSLSPDGAFSLNRLLAGSEGTLCLTKRLTLRLLPKKSLNALFVIAYDNAMAALGDAIRLTEANPTAIEFIDDKIVSLARDDSVWTDISAVLDTANTRQVLGLNFVEIQADSIPELNAAKARLEALGAHSPAEVVCTSLVTDPHVISQLWALRSKCVGLLGRMDPTRQGTPFVEDAAVPPQNLRSFVTGFRDILDAHGLAYGMFGHVDVGCIHVRPALDMQQNSDAAMIRVVSDAVEKLAREHGGILWGEHGKGFRGEYVPQVFGAKLYKSLCEIKSAFDPLNILNPGKIAAPSENTPLSAIDKVPFRGTWDAKIDRADLKDFEMSIKCNGNGQCFNRSPADAMCPSYKASGDRRLSPKGRAAMLRKWLRLRAKTQGETTETIATRKDISALEGQLINSLSKCLACNSCSTSCPVKVDIPHMRAAFFEHYYATHRRPIRHYAIASLESIAPLMRRMPALTNTAIRLASSVLSAISLVNLPPVRPPKPATLQPEHKLSTYNVLIVEDSFTGVFDGQVIESCDIFLRSFGYHVERSGLIENGKALSTLGFRHRFKSVADRRNKRLKKLSSTCNVMIELEPAVSAMARAEFSRLGHVTAKLTTLDVFLEAEIQAGRIPPVNLSAANDASLQLFLHCTESSSDPLIASHWKTVFSHFALELKIQETGCCGMAGIFGHEAEHQAMSKSLFDLSWRGAVSKKDVRNLATGFSCRCQTENLTGGRPRHPIEYLADKITTAELRNEHPLRL